MSLEQILLPLLLAVLAGPLLLGAILLAGRQRATLWQPRLAVVHSVFVLLATAAVFAAWLLQPNNAVEMQLSALLHLRDYHWVPMLLVDRLSILYMVLVALIYPVVVRFSLPSFYREPGSGRYWFLVTLLGAALWLLCVAGNLDTLFVAWELIGVSSVMLIGFFRRQVRAAQNSLRALVYYRIGDFLVLLAAVLIHHDFPDQRFRGFENDLAAHSALAVSLALLGGSLAKSAQLPMSPWLHRAMEGPAASSAIFYGALSVHLGPFLLLRTSQLWLPSELARVLMAVVGVATAVWATLVGRTRPDAKTALAYSTMAQIGLMYVELACGLTYLVAVHLFAHAGLRTWQFLRSSSLIQDFQDNPVFAGSVTLQRQLFFENRLPERWQRWLYLGAVRLFWIDALQWHWCARPFLGAFHALSRCDDCLLARGDSSAAVLGGARRLPSPPAMLAIILGAVAMWWSPNHLVFTIGLLTVLGVPVGRASGALLGGGLWREALPLLAVLLVAILHGVFPGSAPVACVALAVVGGAAPAHLWLEVLRGRVATLEFLLLVLAQPGFALAVHILGPQTVMLDLATRGALASWFVVTAVLQTGLSLVRATPSRAIFGIGLSQTTLLIAGAMVADHGFAAEYSMLAGTNLGLLALVLVTADLNRRYGVLRLGPDNGLADAEPRLARLFLVIGWLFAGLPGGIVFFAEDLLFHALVEHSKLAAAGMIFASVLNGVAFYRVYLGLFSGRMRPGLSGSGAHVRLLVPCLQLLATITLWFGLFPQQLLLGAH